VTSQTIHFDLVKAAQIWERVVRSRPLPWYAEEKVHAGAFAALVGLELTQSEEDSHEGRWSALACGDSCLFQLRSGEVAQAFPVLRPEEFSNAPVLLGSSRESRGLEGVRETSGNWKEGDCFYLMTDALAAWFVARSEGGGVPWQELSNVSLRRVPAFKEWILRLRHQREIKNDDCTLVRVGFD
jgi:hypothetical protein